MAYAMVERLSVLQGAGSAQESIESMGGVDAFMEELLSSPEITVFNLDDEVVKELFRLRNERVEKLIAVRIVEPIDNLDLVVEEVLKLDKSIDTFDYDYFDKTRIEPVYPTLTPEQQQRLREKFPNLVEQTEV